ncbi:uncharacterized protein LOC127637199 isoform X2 [Xyrauchen texanus]|uniref:uncharacterized protein LOC127637199 isoform X2 n=1 Tax=Xyrauchen texanus TaxID=154827 RepID=UPI0022427DC1|nr:uncharacterized protein LOC127637199 isoform X2 [Xyrauchen texanus]
MVLKESPLIWGVILCSLTWTLAWTFTPDEVSSVSSIFHRTTPPATETGMNNSEPPTTNYTVTGLSCASLLPPRRGSFYVEKGTGMSVGSVLVFWCLEGYQLVGSEKISCILHRDTPQWSNYPPDCEAIPKPEDRGLRVAVLASVVSSIVILAMSVSFIICCLQERMSKERIERTDSRSRSQENLLKAPLPGLYRTESQVYPHVVLQRVPTPTVPTAPTAPSAPIYLRLSTPPPTESHTERPVLPPYHKPSGTPQRPWP